MRRAAVLAIIGWLIYVSPALAAYASFMASSTPIGVCGSANGASLSVEPVSSTALCARGTPGPMSGPGAGPWAWQCIGSNGGGTASCTASASAASTTYYVATTGSDSNPGTISQPFLTPFHAVSLAAPGTDIVVRGGTYNIANNVGITASGTPTSYIRLYNYAGETVILDGTSSFGAPYIVLYASGNYVEVSGITVQNGNIDLGTNCANHDLFVGDIITGSKYQGVFFGGCSTIAQGGGYNLARGNTITGNSQVNNPPLNPANTGVQNWSQGISSHLDTGDIIEANTVDQNYGEGIGCYETIACQVIFNTSYDNYSSNIYADGVPNAVISGNFDYSSGNTTFYECQPINVCFPAYGLRMAVESYPGTIYSLSGLIVINNVFVATQYAITYQNYGLNTGLYNSLFANNTAYGTLSSPLYWQTSTYSGNTLYNNIFVASTGEVVNGSSTGWTYDYNNWYGGSGIHTGWSGAHDITSNPAFVSAGGLAAVDYVLSGGSPAIGAGATLPAVPMNFGFASRSSPYNMGAY